MSNYKRNSRYSGNNKGYRRSSGTEVLKAIGIVLVVFLIIGLIGSLFRRAPAEPDTDETQAPTTSVTDPTDSPDQDKGYTVLGFTGLASSSGALKLTGDASGAAKYTKTSNGQYVSVQNELDDMFPFNQIVEYTDAYGNVFVKFPKLYMKWILTDSGYVDGVMISDKQVDSSYFIPDAYLNPSSVGGVDLYNDYFAIGKYEMSGGVAQGYSKSGGQPLTSLTRAEFREAARSYGTELNLYNGYQQLDLPQWTVYSILCMLYYQTSDIQSVWPGCVSTGFAASTGTTDGCVGLNGWNTETGSVKLLGVENPYGNLFTYLDGVCVYDGAAYFHSYPQNYADNFDGAVKLKVDLSVRTDDSSGLKLVFSLDGISDFKGIVFPAGVPSENGSSLPDVFVVAEGGNLLRVGGAYNQGAGAGLFCVHVNTTFGSSSAITGARLTFRPV